MRSPHERHRIDLLEASRSACWRKSGIRRISPCRLRPGRRCLREAQATGRYALYDAKTPDTAPSGAPFHVAVDGTGYTSFGMKYKDTGAGASAGEGASLRDREQRGSARCDLLGERKMGGDAAVGYNIRDARAGSSADALAIHFWVSRSTGLPVFTPWDRTAAAGDGPTAHRSRRRRPPAS